jgi:hypothetical protein
VTMLWKNGGSAKRLMDGTAEIGDYKIHSKGHGVPKSHGGSRGRDRMEENGRGAVPTRAATTCWRKALTRPSASQ